MELQQLRYFIAICDTGNMTRAAEALFVSQQALSKAMRMLSDELKAPLFTRTPRGVTLTPYGHALLPRARRLVSDAEAMSIAITNMRDDLFDRFCLGYLMGSYSFQSALPVRLIAAAERRFPNIAIQISEHPHEQLADLLLRGDLHAAYGVDLPSHARLASVVLAREPQCVLISKEDPLCAEASIDIAMLRGRRLLTSEAQTLPAELLTPFLQTGHIDFARIPCAIGGIIEHIRLGDGFTLAGRAFFMNYNLTGMTILPVRDLPPMCHMLLTRKDDLLPPTGRAIVEFLCCNAVTLFSQNDALD